MQGHRPPSRQKPPPEALHLFGAGLDPGCGAPTLRDGPLMRPSTSASVLRNPVHNMPALRQAPAMLMAQSRMTVGDVRNAADEALRQVRGLVHKLCMLHELHSVAALLDDAADGAQCQVSCWVLCLFTACNAPVTVARSAVLCVSCVACIVFGIWSAEAPQILPATVSCFVRSVSCLGHCCRCFAVCQR